VGVAEAERSDDLPSGPRGRQLWAMLVVFLGLVAVLGVAFALASRTTSAVTAVEELVVGSDSPVTFVNEPTSTSQPPFTITTVTGPGASLALSLPGPVAGAKVLDALETLGLDPMGARVVRSTQTSVAADGSLTPYISVGVIAADGYSDILGVSPDGNTLWYDPVLLQLPFDLSVGRTWTSQGLTLDVAPYAFTGTVVGPATASDAAGTGGLEGCLELRTLLEQQIPGAAGYTTDRSTTWCPGLGAVWSRDLNEGVVTRLADVDEVSWPPLAAPRPPQRREVGARLSSPIPVMSVARPPMTVPGGMVVINGSVQDLAAITVGPTPEDAAVDSSTLTWLQHPGGTVLGAATGDERIFVATSLRHLQSFDHAGRMRWTATLPDIAAGAPVPVGSVVAVALVDGSLRGFSAVTGEPAWTVRLSDVVTASPVRAGDVVVAADTSGAVVAVDDTGVEQWSHSSESVDTLSALPDGSVLVGQTNGDITLLGPDGFERWTVFFPDSGIVSPGTLWGDVIALPTDGGLRGVSVEDGTVLWTRAELPRARVNQIGLVAAADRVLRVTPQGQASTVAELVEPDGSAPAQVFLTRLGAEWVAVSQVGTITYLGVPDE